jgi:hypothetical protein
VGDGVDVGVGVIVGVGVGVGVLVGVGVGVTSDGAAKNPVTPSSAIHQLRVSFPLSSILIGSMRPYLSPCLNGSRPE